MFTIKQLHMGSINSRALAVLLTNILSNRLAFQNVSQSLNCRDPSFSKQELVHLGVHRLE